MGGNTEKEKAGRELSGTIVETLPNAMFRVTLEGGNNEVIAYLSGKMRLNRIRVMVGDSVRVVIDEYGVRGRIVRRV